MKNDRLFKLDFRSVFAFTTIIILILCINSLIQISYNNNSSGKSLLYAWIRVISAILLCIVSITNLRNKRLNEPKKSHQ